MWWNPQKCKSHYTWVCTAQNALSLIFLFSLKPISQNLKTFIECYQTSSGQVIHAGKNKLLFGKVGASRKRRIERILGMESGFPQGILEYKYSGELSGAQMFGRLWTRWNRGKMVGRVISYLWRPGFQLIKSVIVVCHSQLCYLLVAVQGGRKGSGMLDGKLR